MSDLPQVEIFTDGACKGNPGPGGWGAVLRFGDTEKEISGGEAQTTNNRMEMTAALELGPRLKVLEIGTGSGYQAAVLSHLCRRLYTIERHRTLATEAEARFAELRLSNIVLQVGDGSKGWPGQAPFDRISLTLPALLDSDEIVVVARGDDKRTVLDAALAGESDLPIARLFGAARQPVTVFT